MKPILQSSAKEAKFPMHGEIEGKGLLNTDEDRGRVLGSGGGHDCRGAETWGKQWVKRVDGRQEVHFHLNPRSDGDSANWLECLHGSQNRQLGAYIT